VSATNRGAKRDALDRHDTPDWCVHRLLDRLELIAPEILTPVPRWIEPAAGAGNIIRATSSWFAARELSAPRWWAGDVAPRPAPGLPCAIRRQNFLTTRAPLRGHVLLTNPPFRLALRFARHGQRHAKHVALLLRLNWLEGASQREPERAAFLRRFPPDVYVLPNRPSFEKPKRKAAKPKKKAAKPKRRGADATAYAWMVWSPDRMGGQWGLLDETPCEERRR
jgi:hypothetical protein